MSSCWIGKLDEVGMVVIGVLSRVWLRGTSFSGRSFMGEVY